MKQTYFQAFLNKKGKIMARVTVEDCIEKIPNRFDLILTAAGRAKSLDTGAPLSISRDNDKNTVVALREIEEGTINIEQQRENMITSFQRYARPQISATETSEEATEIREEVSTSLYSDTEFEQSDSFQVYDDIDNA